MYAISAITCCVLGLVALNVCLGDGIDTNDELKGRIPPITFAFESFLQYILRNDQQKCMLKLVCTVGSNVTRYGTYGDAVASYFGYKYNPDDFSVVENTLVLEKTGRPSNPIPPRNSTTNEELPAKLMLNDTDVFTNVTRETDPELFSRQSHNEGRTGFPAVYVFNQAFVMGLKRGQKFCTDTFKLCAMDVDMLITFGGNLFATQA